MPGSPIISYVLITQSFAHNLQLYGQPHQPIAVDIFDIQQYGYNVKITCFEPIQSDNLFSDFTETEH